MVLTFVRYARSCAPHALLGQSATVLFLNAATGVSVAGCAGTDTTSSGAAPSNAVGSDTVDETASHFTSSRGAADSGLPPGEQPHPSVPASSTEAAGSDTAPGEPRCVPGPGATGSPKTIIEVVELINSLPMPVTIPCFLQSLDRPLKLAATNSIVSAQPSQGVDNPRLFILRDGISLSVVPTGKPGNFLEIGEFVTDITSIKAEIEFPVTEPLPPEAAFERLLATPVYTICRICHYPEYPAVDYPVSGAFESLAYRPLPELEVNFDYVEWQYTTCDSAEDPDRCAFYSALFDQGQVSRGEFPSEVPVFR